MPTRGGFAFGPFQLDTRAKRLLRDGTPVPLPIRQFDLLHVLVSRSGDVLAKDTLIKAAWDDVSVTDNSLAQAISQLRGTLDESDPHRYIETAARRGYRFAATVARIDVRHADADLDALLRPHRALIDGRAALETLGLAEIASARATFEHLLVGGDDDPLFHIGLANACVLQFEATRTDVVPDRKALQLATTHAHDACRLDPDNSEAFATLGVVLERTGDRLNALAALHRATTLEPGNWRHQLRLAYGSWGEQRLRAARRTLALFPGCALAHCLAATVYVARGGLEKAEQELDAGIAALQGEARTDGTRPTHEGPPRRFSAVALHWLKGLLCLARGADDEAMEAFGRELTLEGRGHLYARECCANTWCAIGAVYLGRDDRPTARAAFEQATRRVPRHPMAHAGLAMLAPRRQSDDVPVAPVSADVAMARAALLVAAGDAPGAAHLVNLALASAPAGNAGWLVSIEPLLGVQRARDAWRDVLARVRIGAA
ncbi:MAG: winged helix-turn-helix domain-containing protein [Acidobacteriota bacterium]